MENGWSPQTIGAGYELFGEDDASAAGLGPNHRAYPVVARISLLPGFELIREFRYHSAWDPGGASIKLLKRLD